MLHQYALILFDECAGLLEAAQQFLFGLGGDGIVDVVDGGAYRENGKQRAAEEDPVRQRRKNIHRRPNEKFTSISPPVSGTATRRDSGARASFQTNTL